ncbi:MAG: cystathionine beta-lyase, partial [Proteobacteria bacterium]|nr:cystathionine beta-lyase [Pseudomonadota bacterium]
TLQPGDHLLMTDSVYDPTRAFCDVTLKRLGVETTYYDPTLGAGIRDLMRPHTKVVFVESPGSLTFEVQDIPAISQVAHAYGALVVLDNTWGTPIHFASFRHGVDVSVHAATKYIVGHSDVLMGAILTTEALYPRLRGFYRQLGLAVSPDDAYLALRGLRTLSVRLERHQRNALQLARWLAARPEVAQVLYPALPEAPGHDIWRRDFSGACGLFAVQLRPVAESAVTAMLDGMRLFGMGYSWGGFESLILLTHPERDRTATAWQGRGPLLRLHVGLENPEDLIADLQAGFDRMHAAHAVS